LQTIRLIIIAWDGRCDWLQTTAEHDVVWSSWAGDVVSYPVHTWTENGSFTRNLTSWSMSLWLVLLTQHEVLQCYTPLTRSTAAWLPADNCTRLADSL